MNPLDLKFPVQKTIEFRGETTLVVDRVHLKEALSSCKNDLGFDYLVDLASVDHLGEEPRFEIVYELYSMARGIYLRIKSSLSEDAEEGLQVPTVSDLWDTANWHEREVYDMMGIKFTGHPDLRRILMWEGYPYFPLRKEFPLAGKSSEVPGVAFTKPAPLDGGPYVTLPISATTKEREPRSRE